VKPDPLTPEERRLLAALIADFQLQTLRKLRRPDQYKYGEIRSMRHDLLVAGCAALKVGYVPPKA
jgi:hypothetical protein